MKKILLFFSLLCMFLVSCTNEEPISPEFQSQNDVEVISFNDDPTILQLSNLNDSLMSISSNVESRGKFWNIFKKVCKIAFADIKGAYNGYKWGSIFGPVGSWVGASVVGIGSSAIAGIDEFSRAPLQLVSQSDVEAAYVITVCDPNFESNKLLVGERVKIDIPQEHISTVELGKVHNLTLKTLQTKDLSTVNIENGFSTEEIEILHSTKLQNYYTSYLNDSNAFDLDFALSDSNSKDEYIVQLFLDLYKNYPSDIDDVNFIINEYIHIIEQDTLLTTEEKQVIYTAIAMAGYSTDYWDQTLSQ